MPRLYFDTSVFICLWKFEQHGRLGIPQTHYVERLVDDAVSCKHFIVTSRITLGEIRSKYSYLEENALDLFKRLRDAGKIDVLDVDENTEKAAFALNEKLGVGRNDCTHLLQSGQCDFFVTLDKRLLEVGKQFANAVSPEELLY
jgi:predicted nucleic acid-binding protein